MSCRAVLEELMARRVVVLDGSMGAFIFARQPTEADYRGARFRDHPVPLKNCTDALVLSRPAFVEEIHRAYLDAGADIIETCTFNATPIGMAEFGLQDHVFEMNKAAAEIARRVADEYTRRNPDKRRFVCGSIGPGTKTLYIEPSAGPGERTMTFEQFAAAYTVQIERLVAGGVDLLAVETGNDILVVKTCLFAIDKYCAEHRIDIPTIVSGTLYHPGGRTLFSQTPEA